MSAWVTLNVSMGIDVNIEILQYMSWLAHYKTGSGNIAITNLT